MVMPAMNFSYLFIMKRCLFVLFLRTVASLSFLKSAPFQRFRSEGSEDSDESGSDKSDESEDSETGEPAGEIGARDFAARGLARAAAQPATGHRHAPRAGQQNCASQFPGQAAKVDANWFT